MHPEVVSDNPGRCPKCGMALIPLAQKPKITVHSNSNSLGPVTVGSYFPLITVFVVIILTTGALSFTDMQSGSFSVLSTIEYFMIGFFLTFSVFKLIDLKGFAEGYQTYDLIAMHSKLYAYLYPFIELAFGLLMIVLPMSRSVLGAEVFIMTISGIGVLRKILRHEPVLCSCLGTVLKVPLTHITLIEDFGMAILALILLMFA